MHELAVCQSVIAEVERVAAAHRATEVTRIVVAIGPLSGVEARLLAGAFTIARAGTVAAAADLDIEAMPITVWCASCEAESAASANRLLCGRCGTWRVDLRSGDQLLLKRLEFVPIESAQIVC
jgi:hydrogenase nickel incorporation protein HypA/HybF